MWDPARDETPPRQPPSHTSTSIRPPARRYSREYIQDSTKFEDHNKQASSDQHSVPPGDNMFTAGTTHGSSFADIDTLMYHMGDNFWGAGPDTQTQKLDTSNNDHKSNHIPLEQSFTTLKTKDDVAPGPASTSNSLNIPTQSTSKTSAGSPSSPSLISHREQFVAALAAPPELALKIMKSVRFRREPSSTARRRHAESPVAFSSVKSSSLSKSLPGSSAKSASPRFSYGGVGNFGSTVGGSSNSSSSLKTHSTPGLEKDPEEKMAELMELKQMKIRQEDLFHLKDQIIHLSQNLEDKESILDEVRVERKSLQSELARYIAMVKQIQRDVELATQAEVELSKEREELSQQVFQLKENDYKILKEEVDQLRSKKGLRPLPSLEQEQADVMGRYLEQRRGQWRQDGLLQEYAGDTANNTHHSGAHSSTAASSSSSSTMASSTGRNSNANLGAVPGSNTGPGPVSRSSSRATTSSSPSSTSRTRTNSARSEKNVQQPSRTHSSNTSRSSKPQTTRSGAVRPAVSTSRSGRQSQRSSPSSSRSRSQSPSVRSSTSSIAERSKKRSRY
ncbi:hypothetical protein BGZ72_005548 [Mortierella alpina]|nr:hypothetical protein BGZ72_005548 [Mortierella alpina]